MIMYRNIHEYLTMLQFSVVSDINKHKAKLNVDDTFLYMFTFPD